jgi:hypothetical protein
MVVQGVYVDGDSVSKYPDIGYSFCNCASLFYTNPENVWEPPQETPGIIIAPDTFFCEWGNNPYSWLHWNPRKYHTLWDLNARLDHLENTGVKVISSYREFDVQSKYPQHYMIRYE